MAPTLEEISAAFVSGHVTLTTDEQRLVLASYRLLATGHPASVEAIAEGAGWLRGDVEARLGSWPGTVRDSGGAIAGFWGLATDAVTDHRMDIEGTGTAWTWCAYDTLFIPSLLAATAKVSSVCPTTAERIRLTVSPDGVAEVEPAEAVISLLPVDEPFDDDVRQTFCHYVLFFSSPDAAEDWIEAHPRTFWIPVTDAFEVAGRVNRAVYPALVGAERVDPTPR